MSTTDTQTELEQTILPMPGELKPGAALAQLTGCISNTEKALALPEGSPDAYPESTKPDVRAALELASNAVIEHNPADGEDKLISAYSVLTAALRTVAEVINARGPADLAKQANDALIATGKAKVQTPEEKLLADIEASHAAAAISVAKPVSTEKGNMVTVSVPKPFNLTLSSPTRMVRIEAGVQDVPLEVAQHEYSIANGMRAYTPAVSKVLPAQPAALDPAGATKLAK